MNSNLDICNFKISLFPLYYENKVKYSIVKGFVFPIKVNQENMIQVTVAQKVMKALIQCCNLGTANPP